ncbi:CALMODULIN-BINDING RECEPTOR-LIKE CYTOPLASMIC KINASE 1 [Salix koriyanagi]|uniref:CALMODULIN-BINDING RECEPTOR-LIKE CYTOPLASMIC KINASE 1 n=1 Tax=Salix koriyanagi TaxID=2511006 RepID=A0A9Q0YZK6_9ROSI|nr:CALMODULIN-BINDING RECEPTOR-LIKE CYTOPLASMIC KINASE 1 [Salix koriyanagi]
MALKMKKASPLHIPCTDPTKQASNLHRKNRSVLSHVKTAVSKVVGAFTILLPRKSKAGDIVTDAAKRNKQVGGISFSTDLSTGSKSSSVLKSSSTYGSSSATSGMVGEGNFSIQEIYKMTDNFSPANEIGDGSFSTVYKGRLRDGSYVAVKRAKKNTYDKRLLLEFQNEALALSKIEHLNLVRFHGYVEQGDERIIVVEYVGNGNLREHLDGKKGSILEIAERLDIAIDVAHAITYLHTYTGTSLFSFEVCADLIRSFNISSSMINRFWMDDACSFYLVSVNVFIISDVSSLLV